VKILFVTRETEADRRYGLGKSILPVLDELDRRGHGTRYLCQLDLGQKSVEAFKRTHRWLSNVLKLLPSRTDLPALLAIILERINMGRLAAKIAAREGFTHVHCHDPLIAAGFRLFSLLRPGFRARWGITQHGFGSYTQAIHADGVPLAGLAVRWMRRWEASINLKAGWVVAPTRVGLEQLAKELGVDPIPAHWHVIPHPRPMVSIYERSDARSRLGWDDEAIIILAVGRMVPLKQFPALIEACVGLVCTQSIKLVILGEGDAEGLKSHARSAGLTIELVTGVTDDIGLYLSASDIYVSLSLTEAFGMANLEALVAGVPAICTAVGGVPEVVGEGAMLISPRSEAAHAGLQQLLDDPAMLEQLGRRGKRRGEGWPDLPEITGYYEKIYRSDLATTHQRP
jgi:glycosyltransferase involved in cell wall biosynthesis